MDKAQYQDGEKRGKELRERHLAEATTMARDLTPDQNNGFWDGYEDPPQRD